MAKQTSIDLPLEETKYKLFPNKWKGGTQEALEQRYTKRWIEWKKKFAKDKNLKIGDFGKWSSDFKEQAWRSFQEFEGSLFVPDKLGEWGDGKPMFKARFTARNKITTSGSVGKMIRFWRDKLLTEGTPGTPAALEWARDQFFDEGTNLGEQLHHMDGIAEYGEPFIDKTINKIITGDPQGQLEYARMSEVAHDNNMMLGSKAEKSAALGRHRHINDPGTFHVESSQLGSHYMNTAGGDAAIGLDHNTANLAPGQPEIPRFDIKKLDEYPRVFTEGKRDIFSGPMRDFYNLVQEPKYEILEQVRADPTLVDKRKPKEAGHWPGKEKGQNWRKRVAEERVKLGDAPEDATKYARDLYDQVSGTARSVGAANAAAIPNSTLLYSGLGFEEVDALTRAAWDMGEEGRRLNLKAIDNLKAPMALSEGATVAGKLARKAGTLIPFAGAAFDTIDAADKIRRARQDPNFWNNLQAGMAVGTVGTSFWNEPTNFALGVGNLAIDATRGVHGIVTDEEKREEAYNMLNALGQSSFKALGLLKY
tara:strand:- start:255 stop:1859 length:1605 start_codon:yes stop_codon:yes gene_type:complete